MTTVNLGLHLLAANQGGAEVTFNESMYKLDAVVGLSFKTTESDPDNLTPAAGDVHLVGDTAENDFAGMEKHIAYYVYNQWKFIPPKEGLRAWDEEDLKYKYYDGTSWEDLYGTKSTISGHISSPVDKDYCLELVAAKDYKLIKLYAVMGSGTCTVQPTIDGATSPSTLNVTDALDSVIYLSGLDVEAGEKLELTVTNSSTPMDLQFSFETEF